MCTQYTPEEIDPNPSGLCMCGCGSLTRVWNVTNRNRGRVAGHHARFVHGHNGRMVPKRCLCCHRLLSGEHFDLSTRRNSAVGSRNTTCRECRTANTAKQRQRAIDDIPARFWAGVDQSGGDDACWPWMGATDKGYGVITIRTPDGRRKTMTHRLALELTGIEVPFSAPVCHRCDNPPCCNPAHLYVGTALQNTHDAMERGQKPARLTEDIVMEARRRYQPYKVGYRELAEEYGCSTITIRDAIVGRTWKHLPGWRDDGIGKDRAA